jgi:hypothetical protein
MKSKIFIFLLFCVLQAKNGYSQLNSKDFSPILESIQRDFPNSVTGKRMFDLAFYTALSFYPELKGTQIEVTFEPIETSMQCRPSFTSIWRSSRKYLILVNDNSDSPLYPFNASFSALVGCFGHELAHIIRYEKQSNSEVVSDGVKFLSDDSFRSQYEKSTDLITISHNLGFEQYEYAKFIFENPNLPKNYLEFKKKIYHTPKELLELYKNKKK